MKNNLNKKEQEILFAEIESIIINKLDLNPADVVIKYIPSKGGGNLFGIHIKIKIKSEQTEDRISLELENRFIINSCYKAFIQNEFYEEISDKHSLIYICFLNIDEYRRYCNHKVNEVILMTDGDKKVFFETIANPREPNEKLKKAHKKRKEIFEE